MNIKHYSYGIIPIYKKDNDIFICCICNKKSGEWGLPKGTPEGIEKPFETAKRELYEETGISEFTVIGGKTFKERYSFIQNENMCDKENTYYVAEVKEMIEKSPDNDSRDMKWITINQADTFFKFDSVKDVVREVFEYLKKFPLVNQYHGRSGEDYIFEYYESDSIEHLPQDRLAQVQAFAFHKDKLLIVNNANKFNTYGPVGGSIEKGETPERCLFRELQEESNMKPIKYCLIGYQKCINKSNSEKVEEYQLRYFAEVEPIGEFTPECDPDGDVTELLEIDSKNYKKYFDWGRTGEEIIKRALELKNK